MNDEKKEARLRYLEGLRRRLPSLVQLVKGGSTGHLPTLRTWMRKWAGKEVAVGDREVVPGLLRRACEAGVALLRCASMPGQQVSFTFDGVVVSGRADVTRDQADSLVWIETFWFSEILGDSDLRAQLMAVPIDVVLGAPVLDPPHVRPYLEALRELERTGRVRQDLVRTALEATDPARLDADTGDFVLFTQVPVLEMLHYVGAADGASFVAALHKASERYERYATYPGRIEGFEPDVAWEASGVAALALHRGIAVPTGLPHIYP